MSETTVDWRDYQRLALKLANQSYAHNKVGCLDDYASEALLAVWLASTKFNPRLGFRFTTYATVVINQKLRKFAADQRLFARRPSVNKKRQAVSFTRIGHLDEDFLAPIKPCEVEFAEFRDSLIAKLPPLERVAFQERAEQGKSFEAIAAVIGCACKQTASKVYARACSRLKRELVNRGYLERDQCPS